MDRGKQNQFLKGKKSLFLMHFSFYDSRFSFYIYRSRWETLGLVSMYRSRWETLGLVSIYIDPGGKLQVQFLCIGPGGKLQVKFIYIQIQVGNSRLSLYIDRSRWETLVLVSICIMCKGPIRNSSFSLYIYIYRKDRG